VSLLPLKDTPQIEDCAIRSTEFYSVLSINKEGFLPGTIPPSTTLTKGNAAWTVNMSI